MHSDAKVREVFALRREGATQLQIAEKIGVSLGQVRKWLRAGEESVLSGPMRRASGSHSVDGCDLVHNAPPRAYAYLLGQYLGDGCLVAMRRDVYKLTIATCDDYPRIRDECTAAIRAVMPERAVNLVRREGSSDLYCYSKHWPCLFPQHGPGRKHQRRIELTSWQAEIALREAPFEFIRGLIHSDGCRSMNRVTTRGKQYEYVRYFFSNRSHDIRMLFMDACGAVGIEPRHNNQWSVSVARRFSVALMEEIVGPKQ